MGILEALLRDLVLVHVCYTLDPRWGNRVFQHQCFTATVHEISSHEQVHGLTNQQLSDRSSSGGHSVNTVLGYTHRLYGWQAVSRYVFTLHLDWIAR
jgi:hypothetical protein